MPSMDALTQKLYTAKEWLTYYRNIWLRNTLARAVDVQVDIKNKETDPEQDVPLASGEIGPVKVRLEERKLAVRDARAFVEALDILLATTESDPEMNSVIGDDALAVAKDMIPKQPEEVTPAEPAAEKVTAEPMSEEKPAESAPAVDAPDAAATA